MNQHGPLRYHLKNKITHSRNENLEPCEAQMQFVVQIIS